MDRTGTYTVTFGHGDNVLRMTGMDWSAVESAARTAELYRNAGQTGVVFMAEQEG